MVERHQESTWLHVLRAANPTMEVREILALSAARWEASISMGEQLELLSEEWLRGRAANPSEERAGRIAFDEED